MMQLHRQLSDETDPERAAFHAGNRDFLVAGVGERCAVNGIPGKAAEQLTRPGTGDVDRAKGAGVVDDMNLDLPGLDPVPEPALDSVGAAGGKREVVARAPHSPDQAVVEDVTTFVQE